MQQEDEDLPVNIPTVFRINTDFGDEFIKKTDFYLKNGKKNHVLAVIPTNVAGGSALSAAYTYEVHSVAIRSVVDRGNSSVMSTQMIAFRAGSLKVEVDPRRLRRMISAREKSPDNAVDLEDIDTDKYIVFRIDVHAPEVTHSNSSCPSESTHMDSEEFLSRLLPESKSTAIMMHKQSIGAGPYKPETSVHPDKNPFVPDNSRSQQAITTEPDGVVDVTAADATYVGPLWPGETPPRITDLSVILAKLNAGQKLVLDLIATSGTAAEANVFVPGKAFHRHLYKVAVPDNISDKQAAGLVASCPQRVFGLEAGANARSLAVRSELCIQQCRSRCTGAVSGVRIAVVENRCVVDIEDVVGDVRQHFIAAAGKAARIYARGVKNPWR